jgi:hypothetical protein
MDAASRLDPALPCLRGRSFADWRSVFNNDTALHRRNPGETKVIEFLRNSPSGAGNSTS